MSDECDGKAKLIPRPLSSVDTGGLNMEKGWPEIRQEQRRLDEASERASQRGNLVGGWTPPPLPPPPELPESQAGESEPVEKPGSPEPQSENTD